MSLCARKGLLDHEDDDQRFVNGLHQVFNELLKEHGPPEAGAAAGFKDFRRGLASAALFEHFWSDVQRPYYQVWPVVYEDGGLVGTLNVSEAKWESIPMRFSPLVLRFPAGREPFGISTLTLQRNRFADLDSLRLFSEACETAPTGSYGPYFMFSDERKKQLPYKDGNLGLVEFDVNGETLGVSVEDVLAGGDNVASIRAQMTPQQFKLQQDAVRLRYLLDSTYFANHRLLHKDSTITTCSVPMQNISTLGRHVIERSCLTPLEGEIQWAKWAGVSATQFCTTRYRVKHASKTEVIEDCLRNTLRRRELLRKQSSGEEEIAEIEGGKSGSYLELTDHVTNKIPEGVEEFLLKIAVLVSMLDQGNDLITPILLKKDEHFLKNAQQKEQEFYQARAARQQGFGWNVGGGEMQSEVDNGSRGPHYVMPFLRLQPYGPGSQLRKLITVRGHFRGASDLAEVPTGFEGDRQPAPVKAVFKPALPSRLRYKILRRDKFTCQICGKSQGDGVKLEVDHKTPRAKGGGHDPVNLWTLCNHCNGGKSDLALCDET